MIASRPVSLAVMLAAFVVSVAASPAIAQRSTTRGFTIGAHLQGGSLTVDDEDPVGGGGIGMRVGYGVNRHFTPYLELDGIKFDVENTDLSGEWSMADFDLGLRYNFSNSQRRWIPFLETAIGGRAVTVEDATSDGSDVGRVTFTGGAFSLGGGVAYYARERFAIESLVKFTGGRFEHIDIGDVTLNNLDIDASSFRFKIGVAWWP